MGRTIRRKRPQPKSIPVAIGLAIAHVLLVCLYYLVCPGLLVGGGILIFVGWTELWSAGSVAKIVGGLAMIFAGIYAFITMPDRIERFTGRDVGGDPNAPGGFYGGG
ncbi:hypothetical protein [Nocardia australiensis]|uniref:hypothetical protein n=1 Tax=Nocardia australiensis TaxID=2887191 RepID=UPI001D138CD3|nr:hypothetical protein [Nocardia australiensis]